MLNFSPELPHGGELDVFVKVTRETFSLYPKFRLHVQSPVEAIFHNVSGGQSGGVVQLACIAAYLLHTHEKDKSALSHIDTIMCNILQTQPSLCAEWSLASHVFGTKRMV